MHLRVQETDRFLAKQGLTRAQVQGMRFAKEQRLWANEYLKRMGLPSIEEADAGFDRMTADVRAPAAAATLQMSSAMLVMRRLEDVEKLVAGYERRMKERHVAGDAVKVM